MPSLIKPGSYLLNFAALSKDHKRYLNEWLRLSLAAIALLAIIVFATEFPLGNIFYDRVNTLKSKAPSNQIIIVTIDDRSIAELGWPINRQVYGSFLKNLADTGNYPKAIGFDVLFIDPTAADKPFGDQLARHKVVLPAEIRFNPETGLVEANAPPAYLSSAASQIAQINVTFDKDGVIRGATMTEAGVPHLALALSGQLPVSSSFEKTPYRRFTLRNPEAGFPTISLSDVIQPGYPLSIFKDKYVLIGATAPSLGDHFPSIYSGQQKTGTPGVWFQASLLEDLLEHHLIMMATKTSIFAISALALVAVLLGILMLSPTAEMFVTLAVIALAVASSFVALTECDYWFDPMPVMVVIIVTKLTWAWRRMRMIASFIVSRTRDLQRMDIYSQKSRRFSFTQDAILEYSDILDSAIHTARNRIENFGKIISKLPEAMLVLNQANDILLVNDRFREQFYDKVLPSFNRFDDLLASWQVSSQAMEHALTAQGNDKYLLIRDARQTDKRYFLQRVDYMLDDATRLYLLLFVDVTELLTYQQQRDRTLQLLSHDMRTPVASITTIARSLKQLGHDDGAGTDASSRIGFHVKRLLSMMDDFILSIRADENQYKLQATLLDNLLDGAIHQVSDLAKDKAMDIVVNHGDDPLFVLIDNRLMERAVINLLVNAIRYGKAGTAIEINITVAPQADLEKRVVCLVQNQIGGPLADDERPTDIERGFGLGLTFVDQVIRRHQGTIARHFDTDANQQAWVKFDLPLVEGSIC